MELEIKDIKNAEKNDEFLQMDFSEFMDDKPYERLFIGLDPGYKNFGFAWGKALVDEKNKKIDLSIEVESKALLPSNSQLTDYNLFVPIKNWFYKKFPRDEDVTMGTVIQEKQYFSPKFNATVSHYLGKINSIIFTFVETKYGTPVVNTDPRNVKKLFGTSKGSHSQNKLAAVEFVENLDPSIKGRINDHEADAFLLIYENLKTTEFYKNFTISVKIKKST